MSTESKLTKRQRQVTVGTFVENGRKYQVKAEIRFDDECGNGHNSFAITGEVKSRKLGAPGAWRQESCGCVHEEISKALPSLIPFLKWHLCSTDGPMHYMANSIYWAQQGNLEHFRSTAIWPDATVKDMNDPFLSGVLSERLPAIMAEFRAAVESLGFTW